MKINELLQERTWTAIDLAKAVNDARTALQDKGVKVNVNIDQGEVVFDVPGGDDLAPALKPIMKPFIIKTMYQREGDRHQYHYYLTRPLNNAEITRIKRS